MKMMRTTLLLVTTTWALAGCTFLDETMCVPNCHARTHASSSLVSFLYADGATPPPADQVPELRLPLRVGLAFLPSADGQGPTAAQREQLLERISARFRSRTFISDIVVIPDYYLRGARGFAGLEGLQRLQGVDLIALASWDQVRNVDGNKWSLGYLTIVGAFVVPGTRQQTTTLVDLAVVDPRTRSLVLRAGGTSQGEASSTLVDAQRDARNASAAGFDQATDAMVGNFDAALTRFEQDVKEGKARVHVTPRSASGGGGALGGAWLLALLAALPLRLAGTARARARAGA